MDKQAYQKPRPLPGRIVQYRISPFDAEQVNRRRTTPWDIADRIARHEWPLGAQAHIGNMIQPGDWYPMMIVVAYTAPATKAGLVNGQVFLDGTDVLWRENVAEGPHPGEYFWLDSQLEPIVGQVRSAPASKPKPEIEWGWLIERGDPPEYYGFPATYGIGLAWTRDDKRAMRFAREEDGLGYVHACFAPGTLVRVVEHSWG